MDLPESVTAPTAALRDTATLLRRNLVLFAGGLAFGFGLVLLPKIGRGMVTILFDKMFYLSEETFYALIHLPDYIRGSLIFLGTVPYLLLFPLVVAGLVGMINMTRYDDVTIGDFVPAGKEKFKDMLYGSVINYVVLISITILHIIGPQLSKGQEWDFIFGGYNFPTISFQFSYWMTALAGGNFPLQYLLGAGAIFPNITDPRPAIELVGWGVEFILLVVLFLIQFYPVAIVVEDRSGIQGVRRSVEFVRGNVFSTFVYLSYSMIFILAILLVTAGVEEVSKAYPVPLLAAAEGVSYDLTHGLRISLRSYLEYGFIALFAAVLTTIQYTYATTYFTRLSDHDSSEP